MSAQLTFAQQNPTPVPIGGVIAWLKSTAGVPALDTSIWMECDGSPFPAGSPMFGTNSPNMVTADPDRSVITGASSSSITGVHTGYQTGISFFVEFFKMVYITRHS